MSTNETQQQRHVILRYNLIFDPSVFKEFNIGNILRTCVVSNRSNKCDCSVRK